MMSSSKKTKYFQTFTLSILLSLIFHIGLFSGLEILSVPPEKQSQKQTIEFEIQDSKNKDSRMFVTDPEIGRKVTPKENAEFKSKYSREVLKQQVASQTGQSKNRVAQQKSSKTIKKKPRKRKLSKNPKKRLQQLSKIKSGISVLKNEIKTEKSKEVILSAGGLQPSTISEAIPNVAKGNFTALNTDQFRFYAFFNRINKQIRYQWVQNVRRLSQALPLTTINRLSRTPRTTHLELVLNKKGEFMHAFVEDSAGARYLDQASIDAFINASPFINPPSGLVDEDGYVRLQYRFTIEWSPRFVAGP